MTDEQLRKTHFSVWVVGDVMDAPPKRRQAPNW